MSRFLLFVITLLAAALPAIADDSNFARSTIDLGVVVSDVDKAVEFYTEAIGFQEVKGFVAPAQLVGRGTGRLPDVEHPRAGAGGRGFRDSFEADGSPRRDGEEVG